jgi:hypothetical protein
LVVSNEQLLAFLAGTEQPPEVLAEALRQIELPDSFLRQECRRVALAVRKFANPDEGEPTPQSPIDKENVS